MTERLRKDAKKIKRFKKSSIVFPIIGGVVLAAGAGVGIAYGLSNLPIIAAEQGEVIIDPLNKVANFTFDFKEKVLGNEVKATIISHNNSNAEDDPIVVFNTTGTPQTDTLIVDQGKAIASLLLKNAPLDKGTYVYSFDMQFVYTNADQNEVSRTIRNLDLKYVVDHDTLDITDPSVTQVTAWVDENGTAELENGFTFKYSGEITNPNQLTVQLNKEFVKPEGATVEPYVESVNTEKKSFVVKFRLKNIWSNPGQSKRVINGPIDILYNLNVIHTSTYLTIEAKEKDMFIEPTRFEDRVQRQFLDVDDGETSYYFHFTEGLKFRGSWMDERDKVIVENTFPRNEKYYVSTFISNVSTSNPKDKYIWISARVYLTHGTPEELMKIKNDLNQGTALLGRFIFWDSKHQRKLMESSQSYHITFGDTKDDHIAINTENPYYATIQKDGSGWKATIDRHWWYFGFDGMEGSKHKFDEVVKQLDPQKCFVVTTQLPANTHISVEIISVDTKTKSFITRTTWSGTGFVPEDIIKSGPVNMEILGFEFGQDFVEVETKSDLTFEAHWQNNVTLPESPMQATPSKIDPNNYVDFTGLSLKVNGFDSESVQQWLTINVEKDESTNLNLESEVKWTYQADAGLHGESGTLQLALRGSVIDPSTAATLKCGLRISFNPNIPDYPGIKSSEWIVDPKIGPTATVQPVVKRKVAESASIKKTGLTAKYDTNKKNWVLSIPADAGFIGTGFEGDTLKDLAVSIAKITTKNGEVVTATAVKTFSGSSNTNFGLDVTFMSSNPESLTQPISISDMNIVFTYESEAWSSSGYQIELPKPEVHPIASEEGVDVKSNTDQIIKEVTENTKTVQFTFSGYSISPSSVAWNATNLSASIINLKDGISGTAQIVEKNNSISVTLVVPKTLLPTVVGGQYKFDFGICVKYNPTNEEILNTKKESHYTEMIEWTDLTNRLSIDDIEGSDTKTIKYVAEKAGEWVTVDPKIFYGYKINLDGKPDDTYWDPDVKLSASYEITGSKDYVDTSKSSVSLLKHDASGNGINASFNVLTPTSGDTFEITFNILIKYNGKTLSTGTLTGYKIIVSTK